MWDRKYRLYFGDRLIGTFEYEKFLEILHINNIVYAINDDNEIYLYDDDGLWYEILS